MSALFEAKGTASLTRRIAAGLVILVGLVFITVTLAQNLFSVGPAFEELIDDFRPALQEEAIATAQDDLAMLGGVGTEFETAIVPALSEQLGMTPEEFVAFTGENFPAFATGVQALPEIVPTFSGLVDTLDSQRALFNSADEIPTRDLPATTVPWGLLFAGLAAIAVGIVLWKPGRLGLILTGVLAVLLIVIPVLWSLPTKSGDADQLNDNLAPIYTAELVTQAEGALVTVGAMGEQMQAEMLPALAEQLGMSPQELNGFLGENFPATAAGLQALPEAMGRFQGLVGIFDANLDNYDTLRPVEFSPIIWMVIIGGAAMIVLTVVAWYGSREEDLDIGERLSTTDLPELERAGV